MFVEDMLAGGRERLVTINAGRSLIEAAARLCSGRDILAVVDTSGMLVGLVTKTDVVRQMSVCDGTSCRHGIASVMTKDVTSCAATDRLEDVSARMKALHLKNIPVVDRDGQPIAMLTARAILRVLLHDVEYEEAQLVDYVKGVGYR